MFQEYLAVIAQGIPTSLLLTVVSLFIAFFLALGLTFLCMYLLRKKINAMYIIFALFGVGILGYHFGVLA